MILCRIYGIILMKAPVRLDTNNKFQKAGIQMDNGEHFEKKTKSTISILSNPFSNGNGGGDFEHRVQTTFLLGLLVDGFSPILCQPITSVDFQAKRLGWDTDDIMISSKSEKHTAKLLCQIKHGVKISKNVTFKKVISSAWNDYKKASFNQRTDKIALITNSIIKSNVIRFIHDQAISASDATDFVDRIKRPQYSNDDAREVFENIRNTIQENPLFTITEDELWGFFKAFTILTFDMDYESSVNEFLIYALLASNCQGYAPSVWSDMVNFAAKCNKNASHVTLDSIPDHIRKYFNRIVIDKTPLAPVDFLKNPLLAKLTLIGSWDDENENDISILERFFNLKYIELQEKIQECSQLYTSNISFCNGVWKINHRLSIIRSCSSLYFDSIIKPLFTLSREIFSETNKLIQSDGKINGMISSEESFRFSASIRKGILHGMALLCNTLHESFPCSAGLIKHESWKFVHNVLGSSDNTMWISLNQDLPIIAEICPDEFLSCLEKVIANNPRSIENLFPQSSENPWFSKNYICSILWALEGLAWDDKYFVKCIRILGLLASLNFEETNSSNTPVNSIVSIMLPWHIQTFASKEKQQNAIKALLMECPDITWKVIVKLLPHSTHITGETSRPQYILRDIPPVVDISSKEKNELYAYYAKLALDIAKNDYVKLKALLTHCNEMDNSIFEDFLHLILEQSVTWTDAQKYPFWNTLQNHRAIMKRNAPDGIDISTQDLINSAIKHTSPSDMRYRYKRLFDPIFIDDDDNWWEKRQTRQENAVCDVYSSFGIDGVVQFGIDVGNSVLIAQKLGNNMTIKECNSLLSLCTAKKLDRNFFASAVKGLVARYGYGILHKIDFRNCSSDFVSWLLSQMPPSMKLFEVANQLLKQDQNIDVFWQSIDIPYMGLSSEIDPNYAWTCLVKQDRYRAAINLFWYPTQQCTIADKEIRRVLIEAATQKSTEKIEPDAIQYLIGLLQQNRNISINDISDVELIYISVLDEYSEVKPRALNYRLANNPAFFCELIELFYKKRNTGKPNELLSQNMLDRLGEIFFNYCVIPGTNWDGNYDEDIFKHWIEYCKNWSCTTNTTEVVLHTIGNGLSYAAICENGLPDKFIMKELDKLDNEEMRLGYKIGVVNQRGLTLVDPEGNPEYELAKKYKKMANDAESLGYSRYAETLALLSQEYINQAENNILECKRDQELEAMDE